MRYDLVVFELDVLANRNARPFVDETLRELTDLGATLGLICGLSTAAVRDLLGSSLQYFDALESDPDVGKAEQVARILDHLEFSSDRALVVAADASDVTAVDQLGVSIAVLDHTASGRAPAHGVSILVLATLSEIVAIVSGHPLLRVVH